MFRFLASSLVVLALAGCSGEDPVDTLEAVLADPVLSANLMPITLPDPWGGGVSLSVTNPSTRTVRNLRVVFAEVVAADGGAVHGEFRFENAALGDLLPGASRSVRLVKQVETEPVIQDMICSKSVVLRLTLEGGKGETVVTSQAFHPQCVH